MGFISTVLWFWSVVYWFWRSVFSMWTFPLRITVRFAISVMSAMSAVNVQVPAQQREQFNSTRGLTDAIKDDIKKARSEATFGQGVLAPLPHTLYAPKTELDLDMDLDLERAVAASVGKLALEQPLQQVACAEETGSGDGHTFEPNNMRVSLQDACMGGSTDQAPTKFKEAHDSDKIRLQLSYTDGVVKVILRSNALDKAGKDKTPVGSWGAIIGQGWPVYIGPSHNDYYEPVPISKTHIILEVGLYGQVLSGDGTGTIVDVDHKTPNGAVMGDRVEYQVEAVPGVNGHFDFKYHLVAHHWAATRVKYDLPASTCKDVDHAHYHAIDTAHFAALRRDECW